ncbi:peroxiredoxin 6a [Leptinotarsa decemlineata]|uniref:peroxiredoxin 6a n=1 Tax=Leptinotarsa decemlineata TaxID=7539 RepID=UPI000C254B2C|nr:peroxiredoxin-6-like [Leptinotarsa decemlineata]
MVNLGDVFPNFSAKTTIGNIKFHDWLGDSWGILFSHPADFTPVCTTEIGKLLMLYPEFSRRNTKVIALSCDPVESHLKWSNDIKVYSGYSGDNFPVPIIADEKRELAAELAMIDPDEKDSKGIPLTARAVFIIDPNKKLRLSILYPATTGRNFDEILRVLDSLQLCDKHKVATPVDWKPGEDVMVQPTVSDEDVKTMFPVLTIVALPSGKGYIRKTPQP